MATPFLAAKIDATPQLQRYVNATPAALGTAAGTAITYATGSWPIVNLSLRFQGALYSCAKDAVRRSIDDGQTWTTVLTFAVAVSGTANPLSGPYVCYKNGIPRLVVISLTTTLVLQYAYSDTGLSGSWTEATSLASQTSILMPMVYRNTIIWKNGTAATTYQQLDPFALTVTTITGAAITSGYGVIWNDKIFFITGTTSLILTSIVSGIYTSVATIEAATASYPVNQVSAWVDPATEKLIIVGRNSTAATWKAWEVTSAYVVTNKTSTMLTGGTLVGYGTTSKIVGVVYDQDTTPGSAPIVYLFVANGNAAATNVNQFKFNGVAALMGDGSGNPNDSGGDVAHAFPDKNIGGERFFTARTVGVDGVPEVVLTGRGAVVVGYTRRKFKSYAPRSQSIVTIGGSPATYNLATTALTPTAIRAGSVTIRGVISSAVQIAQDDGAGVFPVSTLLPSGGTVTYASGVMTGTTATLDALSVVEGLFDGGTGDVTMYRAAALTVNYPAGATKANLATNSHGAISGGNINTGVPADGTECQINVDMSGFVLGDRFSIQPAIT